MKLFNTSLTAVGLVLAASAAQVQSVQAQSVSDDVVRIGVLTEFTGVYSHLAGRGSVEAVKMAVADFGGTVLGKPVEVVEADHQNQADIGAAKAREWFDVGGVDMITELNNSGVALAVNQIAGEKGKIAIINGSSDLELTNEACTPYTIHYAYDGYALAHGTGLDLVKSGGDKWFFLTVDFAFGTSLEDAVTEVVKANGGEVMGSVRHQLGTSDYSSGVIQAQASGANVIGLATTGPDAVSAAKAAAEFGLTDSMRLAGLLLWIQDVDSLGLDLGQGMQLTNAFYWDRDDETRAFSKRYFDIMGGMPNMTQAADYSATLSYLKAVQAAGTDDADAVMAQMKTMTFDDMFAKNATLREDGRFMHDIYIYEVKSPQESKYDWDYLKPVRTIPADVAFQPLSESRCSFVKG